MRIAVTGAAGLTGRAVVTRLLHAGHEVRAVVRTAGGDLPSGATACVADIARPVELATALRDCDVLIHVAGITLGAPVAAAVTSTAIARVVAVSSAGVYSRSRSAAASYRAGERALLSAGRTTLLIRPTMIYGAERDRNLHHVIRFARRYRFLPVIGSGRSLIQPIHYEDLASVVANCSVLEATGIIDAGGPEALAIVEAAREVLAALCQPERILHIPHAAARIAAMGAEAIVGGRLVERVDRFLENRSVNVSIMIALSGVLPRTFAAGVRDEIRELKL